METKKQKKELTVASAAVAEAPETPTVTPVKVLRIDDVSASVFARERQLNGQPVMFHSVTFSRSYRDASGQRQYSKSFGTEDLGKVLTLAQQAREFVQSLAYPPMSTETK